MKRIVGFLSVLLLSPLLSACSLSAKPADPLQDPLAPEPAPGDVTHRILAYGDTRTGVLLFEGQANVGEGIHDWVAKQMLARLGNDKAEIFFMGDSVYSGGATFHYDNFVDAISRFKDAGLSFFPAVGNHELFAGIVGVISPWFESGADPSSPLPAESPAKSPEEAEWREFIADRHRELSKVNHRPGDLPKDVAGRFDAVAKDMEHRILPKLEKLEAQAAAKNASKSALERMKTAQHVMEDLYVKRAKLAYLEQIFSVEKKTFYSIELSKTQPTILAMVLDTNSLDYAPQKEWFKDTLRASQHDLIIVFGHHPPGTIEGWDDDYTAAFRGHKKAVLWVLSHVHAFAYAFPDTPNPVHARGLFVSGGGGAPLDDYDERTVPIQGWTFGPPSDLSGKFYHFLDIRTTREAVYVTVVGCMKKGEPMLVKATYRVRLPS